MKARPRLLLLLGLLAGLGAGSTLSAAAPTPPADRPSIVFLYADDMRWDAFGVAQRDQGDRARFPWVQTPNFDRLAREGVRFRESFVVNSLCSPGRACVLTSRYSHHNGIIGNGKPFPATALTLATQLKRAGYTTGYFGKYHMGQQPDRPGFDYFASFLGQGRYNDCPISVNGTITPSQGWVDDITTGYAIRWLQQLPADQPFLLFLGFKSPHGPRGGENLPERARNLYAGQEVRPVPNLGERPPFRSGEATGSGKKSGVHPAQNQGIIDYLRHISAIDTCVGQLLEALAASGRLESTLIAFAGDNGYYLGEHSLGDKRSAYDESLRVPFLMRLPGAQAPRGVACDAMTLNLDYTPTFLDYAGAPALPEAQGRSLRPAIEAAARGRQPEGWRTAFFYEYFKEPNFESPTVLAVRTTTHKLIHYPGHPEWTELFDLRADPYEQKNLSGDATLRPQLQAEYDRAAQAVGFRWPEGFDPAAAEKAAGEPKAGKKAGKKKKAE